MGKLQQLHNRFWPTITVWNGSFQSNWRGSFHGNYLGILLRTKSYGHYTLWTFNF